MLQFLSKSNLVSHDLRSYRRKVRPSTSERGTLANAMIFTWRDGVQSTLRDTFSFVRLIMASTSAFIITRSAFEVVKAMTDKIGGAELIA